MSHRLPVTIALLLVILGFGHARGGEQPDNTDGKTVTLVNDGQPAC